MSMVDNGLAQRLASAWRQGSRIPLPDAECVTTWDQAFEIQRSMVDLLGEAVGGWKIAVSAEPDGTTILMPGRILSARIFDAPAAIPRRLWEQGKLECEFGFRLTTSIPVERAILGGEDVLDGLEFCPAFELAGNRFTPSAGGRERTQRETVADNGGGLLFVVGEAIKNWRSLDFRRMAIVAHVDGDTEPLALFDRSNRKLPQDLARFAISHAAKEGFQWKAGDFISTGALTIPKPLKEITKARASFGDVAEIRCSVID